MKIILKGHLDNDKVLFLLSNMNKVQPKMQEIDLEANRPKISNENCVRLISVVCIALIIIVFVLPLIIADLYFAYNTEPCQFIENDSIHFTLNTWLKVTAFANIAILIVVVLVFIFVRDEELLELIKKVLRIVVRGFSFSWIIVGSILFWKYVDGYCNKPLNDYMYARLIIGLISIVSSFCSSKKDNK